MNRWQKKDRKRRILVDQVAYERLRLKAKIRDASASMEGEQIKRRRDQLAKMPRDGSATRVRNRCVEDGSARSILRKFRRSRFTVRNRAATGQLPGYSKASW